MRTAHQIAAESRSEQELLDGLPIPAAILAQPAGRPATVERANDGFRRLTAHDERLRGALTADIPLLGRTALASALRAFFDGDDPQHQFEADIMGRQLIVRMARLSGTSRCLLTLLDRTSEFGPERSYRPQPLRDPLTGLPNGAAFAERVAEIRDHPNYKPGSHAVLSVGVGLSAKLVMPDLIRHPSSPPYSEKGRWTPDQVRGDDDGSIDCNDELLLAAARRLLSALRAGDLLARTGAAGFSILMRLDRGPIDADELADRLRAVLDLPFRLSTAEVRAAYSVECRALDT